MRLRLSAFNPTLLAPMVFRGGAHALGDDPRSAEEATWITRYETLSTES